jgi:hypothetical protein
MKPKPTTHNAIKILVYILFCVSIYLQKITATLVKIYLFQKLVKQVENSQLEARLYADCCREQKLEVRSIQQNKKAKGSQLQIERRPHIGTRSLGINPILIIQSQRPTLQILSSFQQSGDKV